MFARCFPTPKIKLQPVYKYFAESGVNTMTAAGLECSTCGHRTTTLLRRLWTILLVTTTLQHHANAQWWPFNTNFSIITNQVKNHQNAKYQITQFIYIFFRSSRTSSATQNL